MTEGQRKLADLSDEGASPEQIGQAKQLLDLQERLQGMTKVEGRDPFADFSAKIGDLQALAQQGKVRPINFPTFRVRPSCRSPTKLSSKATMP